MTDATAGNPADPSEKVTPVMTAEQEQRRSNVRINVTYLMTVLYATAALVLIVWFLANDKLEEALAIFTSVASISGGIIGFWFGNRASEKNFLPPKELLALVRNSGDAESMPSITSVTPASLTKGGQDTELTVTGRGFAEGTTAEISGNEIDIKKQTETQLIVTVPAASLTVSGSLSLVIVSQDGQRSAMRKIQVK